MFEFFPRIHHVMISMGRIEINFFMLVEKIYVSFGIRSKHCPDQRISKSRRRKRFVQNKIFSYFMSIVEVKTNIINSYNTRQSQPVMMHKNDILKLNQDDRNTLSDDVYNELVKLGEPGASAFAYQITSMKKGGRKSRRKSRRSKRSKSKRR